MSEITEFNCSADAPHGLIDLTPAYAKGGGPNPPTPATERVVRGFSIVQNFSRIIIRDEWIAAGADNVYPASHAEQSSVELLSHSMLTLPFATQEPNAAQLQEKSQAPAY